MNDHPADRRSERVRVALVSLLLTWVFFIEYIPPFKKVHIWSDIEGYHYPLLNYIFISLRQGRLPLWDPSIYSGISLVGNIQAGLFYPPNWLLFLMNAGRSGMLYTTVEILAFLHVWLSFVLAFLWLRDRSRHWLPALMGAGVVAFCGYVLSQFNHCGVADAYAWMPLGLWGIDQASRTGRWRPLWKLAVCSAMCILSGYPPAWLGFAIVACVYALTLPVRFTLLFRTLCVLCFGLLLAGVQLLPALDAVSLKELQFRYGGPLADEPWIHLSFLLPNYYNGNRLTRGPDFSDGDYFYLGIPALFGLLYVLRHPRLRGSATALAVASVCWLIIDNPKAKLEQVVNAIPVLPDVLRSYNLLIAFPLASALLAASAADDYLQRRWRWRFSSRWTALWIGLALAWSTYLLWLWPRGKPDFLWGLKSGSYAIAGLLLTWSGLTLYRAHRHVAVAATLLTLLFVDYKAFGTNRRFSAASGSSDVAFSEDVRVGGPSLTGVNDKVYAYLRQHPWYRIAIGDAPHPTEFRHYGLATPQGFDPFISRYYKEAVERFQRFRTDRLFDMQPHNEAFLKEFGVGFVMARDGTDLAAALQEHPRFRLREPADSFYKVYEYTEAEPVWRYDGSVTVTAWTPERRMFAVQSSGEQLFRLTEEYWPGWKASVDSKSVPVERCGGTFQCATVPAGSHSLEFRYAPDSLYWGTAMSFAAWSGLTFYMLKERLRTTSLAHKIRSDRTEAQQEKYHSSRRATG